MLREFKLLFLALSILFAFGQVSAQAEEIRIERGGSIQQAIDSAKAGDSLVLMPGVYKERLIIDKPLRIKGIERAVIDGSSQGNVIMITALNVSVEGLIIQNSGNLQEDSGIFVKNADGTKISGNTIKDVHNGIYIANSSSNQLIDNKISSYQSHFSKRGNGIHLFKGSDHELTGNEIAKVQDGIYFDFTKSIDVTGNQIRESRYGMHFMFSRGILADRNTVEKNITGMMVMNSSGLQITDNKVTHHFHVRGYGVLIYESKDVLLEGNDLIRNSVGLSIEYGENSVTRKNVIAANQVGLEFKGKNQQNTFSENNFIGNVVQSKVSGEDMRLDDGEKGNYWDDYGSFDVTGDGIGEEAYKAGSLYDRLLQTQPYWQFFFESPSIKLWTKAESLFPSFGDANVFDARPLVEPVAGLVEKEPEAREFVLETGVVGALFILFSLIVIVKGRKLI